MRRTNSARVAAHDAVRVEHDHVLVVFTPAAAKIGDVAGFAADIFWPVPVEEPTSARHLCDEFRPGSLLVEPNLRVGGVAEHKDAEGRTLARRLERLGDGTEIRENFVRLLIINRHHNGGRREVERRVNGLSRKGSAPRAAEAGDEPECGRPERKHDRQEQDREQCAKATSMTANPFPVMTRQNSRPQSGAQHREDRQRPPRRRSGGTRRPSAWLHFARRLHRVSDQGTWQSCIAAA